MSNTHYIPRDRYAAYPPSGLRGIGIQYPPGSGLPPGAIVPLPMPNGRPAPNGMGQLVRVPAPEVPSWLVWGLAGAGAFWLFSKYVK